MMNMKISIAAFFLGALLFFGWLIYDRPTAPSVKYYGGADRMRGGQESGNAGMETKSSGTDTAPAASQSAESAASDTSPDNGFASPLERAKERVTKKTFGIFIEPSTSPVQPERFRGYHTGADFEVLPGEEDREVPVKAVCDGRLDFKRQASGYGGLLAQSCRIDGRPVSVIYGHLKLSSISAEPGEEIKRGDRLGILGAGKSPETDGERKHLHLGFFWGSPADIRGYVMEESQLEGWADPCDYVCQK